MVAKTEWLSSRLEIFVMCALAEATSLGHPPAMHLIEALDAQGATADDDLTIANPSEELARLIAVLKSDRLPLPVARGNDEVEVNPSRKSQKALARIKALDELFDGWTRADVVAISRYALVCYGVTQ